MTGNADIVYNQPTTEGDEFFKTLNVNVKTDSNTGYNLYLSSDQEETALISLDPTNPYKIASVSGNNNNIATHMTNSYGYNVKAVDDKLYNYIPKLSTPEVIKTANSPIEETFNFNLGFRFNNQIPAGNYQRKLLFTLMVEGDSSAKLVSGREFNAALKNLLMFPTQVISLIQQREFHLQINSGHTWILVLEKLSVVQPSHLNAPSKSPQPILTP